MKPFLTRLCVNDSIDLNKLIMAADTRDKEIHEHLNLNSMKEPKGLQMITTIDKVLLPKHLVWK